jgi:PAS domain S-box-containing protein
VAASGAGEPSATTVSSPVPRRRVSLKDELIQQRQALAQAQHLLAVQHEELRQSTARFRTMADQLPVFMFTSDPEGRSDYINRQFLDYTGLSSEAASGLGWMSALHPDDHDNTSTNWQKAVAERKPFEMAFRLRAADGTSRWFRSTAHPVLDESGTITKWFSSCSDIDDLMRTQAELAAVNERLEERVIERTAQLASANKELLHEFKERQRLEHEITEISERERRSLGQALHDGVCQHLSGVGMMAATLSDVFGQKSDPETAAKLREIATLIRSATIDARDVARGLNPVDVDANGLVAALRDITTRYDVPGQTRCTLTCHENVPVHDNSVAMHLYRIVQEAVVNASRHAHARSIRVHLGIRQRDLMLSITDDGIGLPPDYAQSPGLGLKLMRYRASSIGATFAIAPRPAGGTVIKCSLTVPA